MTDYQKAGSIYSDLGNELYESYTLPGMAVLYSKLSLYDTAEKIRPKLKDYFSRNIQPLDVAINPTIKPKTTLNWI